jgi:uncharacterized protein YcbX
MSSINDWVDIFNKMLVQPAPVRPAWLSFKRSKRTKDLPAANDEKRRLRAEHVARVAEQSRDEFLVSLGGRVSLRDWKRIGKRTAKARKLRAEMLVAAGKAWADGGFGHGV